MADDTTDDLTNFVSIEDIGPFTGGDPLQGLKRTGTFSVSTPWPPPNEVICPLCGWGFALVKNMPAPHVSVGGREGIPICMTCAAKALL